MMNFGSTLHSLRSCFVRYKHEYGNLKPTEEFIRDYRHLANGEILYDIKVNISGRITAIRQMGSIHFLDVVRNFVKIQIMTKHKIEYKRGDILCTNSPCPFLKM